MDLRQALLQRYPYLARYQDRYEMRPGENYEFYPQGERDSPNGKTRVIMAPEDAPADDIAGEMVSHDLAQGVDPTLSNAYAEFQRGMTPDQESHLRHQYDWERENYGEDRDFETWRKVSGQPAYFRGYMFGQWPADEYTPEQRATFDKLRAMLGRGK